MPVRYTELKPQELDLLLSKTPLAILPIGALEWHGAHLPLGLDGLVAEVFAERLADKTGAVLLPCFWTAITTLPHPHSLQISTEALRLVLDETLGGLYGAGARVVCLVTGHYAQGHEMELYDAATRAMDRHRNLRVLAATPLELLADDSLLDHAGRWETAQLLALRPELVDTGILPEAVTARRDAVLGEDPRLGSAKEGEAIIDRALETWSEWVRELLATADTAFLREFYNGRRKSYGQYVQTYYSESWEQAILDWWMTRAD